MIPGRELIDRARKRPAGRGVSVVAALLALIGSLLVAPSAAAAPATVDTGVVRAAAVVGFNAEHIISDALFYDSKAMTAAQIQSFLDGRIGTCTNGKCLNVLSTSISNRDAVTTGGNTVCTAIKGGTMRVSELIYRVQTACGISAKVILVTLQKEQGLVTSKAPSDWALRAAMGASCPDTAPCDPAYSGIGPQLVQGVKLMKTYRYASWAKKPGSTWIGYNPSTSCGGTTLNIRNWATAALYTYTPYQPNKAALAAGFGLGDSCSAYGNRNFYSYYTSWFGSTTAAVPAANGLVQVGADIYLVSDGSRYHVTLDDWPSYRAAFGAPRSVTADVLASTQDAGTATAYLRNTKTGTVAYLEGGATHRFSSCDLVAAWGASCTSGLTPVGDSTFTLVKQGAEMTQFARLESSGRVHRIEKGKLVPYLDAAAVTSWTGAKNPYAAVMASALSAKYPVVSAVRIAQGALVKTANSDRVWMATGTGAVHYLPSFDFARDLGLSTAVSTVSQRDLSSQTDRGALTLTVGCGNVGYFAASGVLYKTEDGLTSTRAAFSTGLCDRLKKSAAKAGPIFVKTASSEKVYVVRDGAIAHVPSYDALVRVAGGSSVRILSLAKGSLSQFAEEPFDAAFAAGKLVVAAGDPRVWLSAGDGRVLYLPSFGVASDLGLSGSVTRVTPGELKAYRQAGTLSAIVGCGGVAYLGASGSLYRVPEGAGFSTIDLGTAVCARLTLSSQKASTLFVKTASSPDVYVLRKGKAEHVPTVQRLVELGGGKMPRILTVTAGTLSQLR